MRFFAVLLEIVTPMVPVLFTLAVLEEYVAFWRIRCFLEQVSFQAVVSFLFIGFITTVTKIYLFTVLFNIFTMMSSHVNGKVAY